MDLDASDICEQNEVSPPRPQSKGIRVRDMIKRYDTAMKSDSAKTSYSSIPSTKSSYFGVKKHSIGRNISRNSSPTRDICETPQFVETGCKVQDLGSSTSRSSSASRRTVRSSRSPRIEMTNDLQFSNMDTQKSLMNLSRTREPPKAAPREKKPRHSVLASAHQHVQLQQEEHSNVADASYQSKTTISKTAEGVRIIIDIFFDQNKGLTIEDVVGSRVETDIPPSKILTEFQKKVAEASQN